MANLASTWLSEHGSGSLRGKDQESLRLALLRDLGHVLGCSPRPVVEREVDQFLASGRVSEANLRRLLRRTEARLASESGYSKHSSVASGSQSASEPRAPVPEELLKWSQVAKLACREAELEVVQKREAKRVAQDEIRSYLQRQIDEKNWKKQKAVEEERNFCLLQDAELERWKRDQAQKAEERLQKVQQVLRDREAQSEEVYKRREAEREQKMDEDKRLVQRATREMEKEQAAVAARRQRNRLAQAAWVQEATESKQTGPAARQKRIEEEKQILQDYVELLEMQDKRRREVQPRIREQSPVLPPRVKRKGEELYYDEAIVQRIHKESLARAELAEKRKQERLKMQRFENQAFLSQQIAERDEQKRCVLEQKGGQKAAAQAAAEEARQKEQCRVQERRARYLQNRLELEGQMNKKSAKLKQEDDMSLAEKAINRRYVMETFQKTSEGVSPH